MRDAILAGTHGRHGLTASRERHAAWGANRNGGLAQVTELLDDHGPLLDVAETIIGDLQRFETHMRPGEVHHMQHSDFATRACHLSLHLGAVHTLVQRALYPSAFALLRTALEHHLLDHLAFLGRRYVQVFEGVTDEQWEQLMSDYESGTPGARTICEPPTRSRKGRVTIVREGLYASDEDSETSDYTVSHVYFVLQEYQPLTGRPSDQEFLDDGLLDVDKRVQQARQQKTLWEQHLKWSSLTESLERNSFYSADEVQQLQVHYRFLSAFAHATDAAYDLAYPRGILGGNPPVYDHYSSELALLYVNAIAARELDALLEMTEHPPAVDVPARDELMAVAGSSRQVSRHLWFPGDEPHGYDRVVEANRRVWRHYRESKDLSAARNRAVPPEELAPEEVSYYNNPHQRIVQLHQSFAEMTTGFAYRSPWERGDAPFR
jgi:hypothetical protein